MKLSHKNKFYLGVFLELIISPWLFAQNFIRWNFGNSCKTKVKNKIRSSADENKLAVCVHEWGGYEGKRLKTNKKIPEFECGLDYQLLRFQNYTGKYKVDLTVTVSDIHLFKSNFKDLRIVEVSNLGMDFSGYSTFYESIKNDVNQYIILTNSSVNKIQTDFIDDYVDFFKDNITIGMLGVSFSSKMYQSFITNNFKPHLQSFFLLTTTNVLREVIDVNGEFPGNNIDYKLALIKYGEIELSRIVMNLGYKLCCILDNGEPFLFDKTSFKDNGRNNWSSFYGDYRLSIDNPNAITSLKLKKIRI